MREVKFRAWDGMKYVYSFTKKGKDRLGWFFSAMPGFKKEQFTGLHDKNGKEIYEGDIVNLSQCGGVVSRRNRVDLADFLGGHYWVTNHGKTPVYEVIGNIHENPELLEELA